MAPQGGGTDRRDADTSQLSDRISAALRHDDLTVGELTDVLDDGSFALVLMVLLLPSALPVPTGGVTHVLELSALLVAGQLALGRRELWLPSRVARHRLGARFKEKGAPKAVSVVRWFERWTRPRGARLLTARPGRMAAGILVVLFVVGAILAPPFSGLDTLPSIGVVVVSVGLLVDDGLVVGIGTVLGALGIALVIALGTLAWSFLT